MTKWISIKDKQPNAGEEILFCSIDEANPFPVLFGLYLGEIFKSYRFYSHDSKYYNATHWIRLPELPKGTDKMLEERVVAEMRHIDALNTKIKELDERENGYIKRIGILGHALNDLSNENNLLRNNIGKIEKLEKEVETMKIFFEKSIEICCEVKELMLSATLDINTMERIPHKCPICAGKGYCNGCNGKGEFYTGNSPGATAHCEYCKGMPKCKPCEGKGIVWA